MSLSLGAPPPAAGYPGLGSLAPHQLLNESPGSSAPGLQRDPLLAFPPALPPHTMPQPGRSHPIARYILAADSSHDPLVRRLGGWLPGRSDGCRSGTHERRRARATPSPGPRPRGALPRAGPHACTPARPATRPAARTREYDNFRPSRASRRRRPLARYDRVDLLSVCWQVPQVGQRAEVADDAMELDNDDQTDEPPAPAAPPAPAPAPALGLPPPAVPPPLSMDQVPLVASLSLLESSFPS